MGLFNMQIITVLFLTLIGVGSALEVPLFMWSGGGYISCKNETLGSITDYSSFDSILHHATQLDPELKDPIIDAIFSSSSSGDLKPDVVVLFIQSNLRSDQVARYSTIFSNLETRIEQATSSVIIPYLYIEDDTVPNRVIERALVSVAQSIEGQVIIVGDCYLEFCTSYIQQPEKLTKLHSIKELSSMVSDGVLNSNKLNLLIVALNSQGELIEEKLKLDLLTLDSVQSVIDSRSKNYISLYISSSATKINDYVPPILGSKNNFQIINRLAIDDPDPEPANWSQYFPVWFWEGAILIVIVLLVGFWSISSIMNIQTPDAFMAPKRKDL